MQASLTAGYLYELLTVNDRRASSIGLLAIVGCIHPICFFGLTDLLTCCAEIITTVVNCGTEESRVDGHPESELDRTEGCY
jgi:hypothetical protein